MDLVIYFLLFVSFLAMLYLSYDIGLDKGEKLGQKKGKNEMIKFMSDYVLFHRSAFTEDEIRQLEEHSVKFKNKKKINIPNGNLQ